MEQSKEHAPINYLRQPEAVRRTGLSRSWFERMRWSGGGPVFSKLANGAILYPEKEFNEYFAARLVSSTTDASEKNLLVRKSSQSATPVTSVTTTPATPQIELAPKAPAVPPEIEDEDLFN